MFPFARGPGRDKTVAPALEAVAEQFAGPLYVSLEAQRTAQLERRLVTGPVARP